MYRKVRDVASTKAVGLAQRGDEERKENHDVTTEIGLNSEIRVARAAARPCDKATTVTFQFFNVVFQRRRETQSD